MVAFARQGLQDSQVGVLSDESRFLLAYEAAHSISLAAKPWHGYRSENRYLVFQCLQQTVGLDKTKCRVLDLCHQQRNPAVYQGHVEISTQLLQELIEVTTALISSVAALGSISGTDHV